MGSKVLPLITPYRQEHLTVSPLSSDTPNRQITDGQIVIFANGIHRFLDTQSISLGGFQSSVVMASKKRCVKSERTISWQPAGDSTIRCALIGVAEDALRSWSRDIGKSRASFQILEQALDTAYILARL